MRKLLEYNQKYFSQREKNKNALAISSNQSNKIKSYSLIEKRYKETLECQNLSKCPDYWGGFLSNHIILNSGKAMNLD